MLEVKNITKLYDGKHGCSNVSFTLEPSEILGIIGTNGSGKTTTFKCLLQLLQPDKGEILLDGEKLQAKHKERFGFLPEERCLYKDLKVYEQLKLIGQLKKMDPLRIEEQSEYYMEKLGIEEHATRRIQELSKGNQQKVQLICALLNEPEILVLDEPLSGLDVLNAQLFKDLLMEEVTKGKMIVLSSHQFDAMEEFFEKVLLMRDGVPVYYGPVKDLKLSSPLRYLSFVTEEKQDYYLEDGVVHQSVSGREIRLTMENEAKAVKLMKKLLKNIPLDSLTIELPTLKDIIQENRLL